MTFDQFLRILRARWKLALSIFLAVVIGTVIATLLFPKKYLATTTVLLDARPDAVSAQQAISPLSAMSFLATQIDLIESPAVARRVVSMLRLNENAAFRENWIEETKGKGDFESWLGELMSKGLKVKPSRESNVVEITYEGSNPVFSSAMANAFAKAYIDITVQFRTMPAKQYSDFFEERAKLAREKLEAAQQKLAAAQKEKGIVATEERLDVEMMRLTELSQQVLALRANRSDAESRSRESQRNPGATSEVLGNSLIASLKAELAKSEVRLQELSERYGDNHPQIIAERANISKLQAKVQAETSLVSRSLNSTSRISSNRESDIAAAYEAQKERILRMKEARSELSVLEREVESALRIYDAIMARLGQASLEGSTSQAGVMILSPATEPIKPSSPKMILNLPISVVLGALLAVLATLVLELTDRRIRTLNDLQQLLQVAPLGSLPRPQTNSSFVSFSLPGMADKKKVAALPASSPT